MTSPPPAGGHTQRPEIQGLRTVAVMAVVLFHLWPNRLPGGYVGVDVFFVISGFLITGNLLREVGRTGSVGLAGFWARRVRRLLPAALLVLAVTAVGVILWVPKLLWQQFFKEIGAATLYVENWSLARDAVDYLAADNAPSPVQHYWTLSVEEQFYIAWPLLILLALLVARRARRISSGGAIAAVLGTTVAASFVFSLWQTEHDGAIAYFSTLTRAWEFGLGAMLAIAGSRLRLPDRVGMALGWLGLAFIAASSFWLSATTAMPGFAALWPVLGGMLVIAAGSTPQTASAARLLSLRPATFIGDISYAIYLWHWPLIVLGPYALGRPLETLDKIVILVATILLSWATKVWVEDPVRLKRGPNWVSLVAGAGVMATMVAGCVVATQVVDREQDLSRSRTADLLADPPECFGAAARAPEAKDCPNPALRNTLVPAPTDVARDYFREPGCDDVSTQRPIKPCRLGTRKPGVEHIALIGDSHARALLPALKPLIDSGKLSVDLFESGGCAWADGRSLIKEDRLRRSCESHKKELGPLLLKTHGDYSFILTTSWTNRTTPLVEDPADAITKAWAPLAKKGAKIVAVRDNPAPGWWIKEPVNTCLAGLAEPSQAGACALDRRRALRRFQDPYAAAVRRTQGAVLIDMTRFYCGPNKCPVVIGGVNVYRDASHITTTYMKTLSPYFLEQLRSKGLLTGSASG